MCYAHNVHCTHIVRFRKHLHLPLHWWCCVVPISCLRSLQRKVSYVLHRLLAFDFWLHFSTAWNIKPFEHEKSGERLFNSATYITVTIWYETLSHLSTYSRMEIIVQNDNEYWIFIFILISIDIRFSFNNQKKKSTINLTHTIERINMA